LGATIEDVGCRFSPQGKFIPGHMAIRVRYKASFLRSENYSDMIYYFDGFTGSFIGMKTGETSCKILKQFAEAKLKKIAVRLALESLLSPVVAAFVCELLDNESPEAALEGLLRKTFPQ
jgi:hypothetical protein